MDDEDQATHCIYLPRSTVQRLLHGALNLEQRTPRGDVALFSRTLFAYLEACLSTTRSNSIEIRGTQSWMLRICTVCGDCRAAFEIGRQLQGAV